MKSNRSIGALMDEIYQEQGVKAEPERTDTVEREHEDSNMMLFPELMSGKRPAAGEVNAVVYEMGRRPEKAVKIDKAAQEALEELRMRKLQEKRKRQQRREILWTFRSMAISMAMIGVFLFALMAGLRLILI